MAMRGASLKNQVVGSAARGRPVKSGSSAGNEAASIIELALMLKLGRTARIKSMGFTETTALRYVLKRRRGLVGAYIGTTIIDMLMPTENRTRAALRLITEHGLPLTTAARIMKLDRRTLTRMVKDARQGAAAAMVRTEAFADSTEVNDLVYLPENPPA